MNPDPSNFTPSQMAQLSTLLFDPIRLAIAEQSRRPIAEHLEDYAEFSRAKGNGKKHVRDSTRRVRLMIRLCRVRHWTPTTPSKSQIQIALGKLRSARPRQTPNVKPRARFGLATVNHYLNSLKGFAHWMVCEHRAERSPCLGIKPYNARTDVRRQRRALKKEETLALIQSANAGEKIAGIPGHERAIMYTLAATTGLRAGELEALTRGSFHLDGQRAEAPHLIAHAAYAKGGRTHAIPLRLDVAGLVRVYLDQCGRSEKLFRRPANNSTRALRVDLDRAGIEYEINGEGFADFHSLRHTFITNLFDAGATPKEAQTLARHQDARLTLGRYAHVTATAQRAAVERLPAITPQHRTDAMPCAGEV